MNVAVADYPGAAALRRRRQAHEARGEVFPDAGAADGAAAAAGGGGGDIGIGGIRRDVGGNNNSNNNNNNENIAQERAALAQQPQQQAQARAQAQRGRQNVNRTFSFRLARSPLRHLRTSQLYCLASLCVALLAIVTTTAPSPMYVLFLDPDAAKYGSYYADQKLNRWQQHSPRGGGGGSYSSSLAGGSQVSASGGGSLTSGGDSASSLTVENIARAAAAAVSGNGDISIVQQQQAGGDNGGDDSNAANNNFSPPSSYADLFRPFREYARGALVDFPVSLQQLHVRLQQQLQQQQQQQQQGVEGGEDVKGSGKDHHRGGSGSKDRDKSGSKDKDKEDGSSSQLLNYDSFFFLPQKYLPSGLKWLVGTSIPSPVNDRAAGSSSSGNANDKTNNNNNRRRHKHPKHNKGHDGRAKANNANNNNNNNKDHPPPNTRARREKLTPLRVVKSLSHALTNLIDPSIRNPSQDGFTKVVDKVLTSTFRLLAIANLLLAVTYLLHGAVAEWFLGGGSGSGGGGNVGTGAAAAAGAGAGGRAAGAGGRMNLAARPNNRTNGGTGTQAAAAPGQGQQAAAPAAAALPNTRLTRSTRERLGGYLLFKLLLISAVVEPDTLDLLILLSWYTLLSFLRSLAHLAGSATSHAAQSGSAPLPGVLRLLVAVLLSDFCAAAVCAALFHGAGWSTVLLLACDCALLAVDVLAHIARHVGQVLEDKHASEVGALEDEQLRLGEEARNSSSENLRLLQGGGSSRGGSSSSSSRENEQEQDVGGEPDTSDHPHLPLNTGEEAGTASDANDAPEMVDEVNVSEDISSPASPTQGQLRDRAHRESRRIDRQIELLESRHSRQLSILDTVVFGFELAAYMLTICHFLHIWSLHGVSFGLVDGVLALHLHSAVSAMGRKIAERRNLNRIARDLDSHFADATEIELRKSAQAGDVCSVCLGTMSGLRNVKKVGCGHLYHTHCLREVVERARSIEAAKCPLCRASVLNGAQAVESSGGATTGGNAPQQQDGTQQGQQPEQQPPEQQQPQQQARQGVPAGDQALFSFSTENILPNWIPLPALSFEIVRRPPTNNNAARIEQRAGAAPAAGGNNALQQQQEQRPQQQGEMPFWRRLLILSGAIPMSAEEEAAALEQLVDMFPQYDRSDLLRELRLRGSAEGVVEAVLAGVFSGVARGVGAGAGAGIPQQPEENGRQDANANNLFEEDDNSILDTESVNDDQAEGNDDEPESNEN